MALSLGVAAFVAWGVLWLLHTRWQDLPAYHRPRLTHHPAYALAAGPLRKALLASSLLALGSAHWMTAAALAMLLVGGWAWRRFLASPAGRRRAMRRDFVRLKHAQPQAADAEILCQVILARHRRWGMELVQLIVQENPTLEGAARVVARMEQELRG